MSLTQVPNEANGDAGTPPHQDDGDIQAKHNRERAEQDAENDRLAAIANSSQDKQNAAAERKRQRQQSAAGNPAPEPGGNPSGTSGLPPNHFNRPGAENNYNENGSAKRTPGKIASVFLAPKRLANNVKDRFNFAADTQHNIGYDPNTGKRVGITPRQMGNNFIDTLGKFGKNAVAKEKTLYKNQTIKIRKGVKYVITTEKREIGGPYRSRVQTIVTQAKINADGSTTPYGVPEVTESVSQESNLGGISYRPPLGSLPLPTQVTAQPVDATLFRPRRVQNHLNIATFRSPLNPRPQRPMFQGSPGQQGQYGPPQGSYGQSQGSISPPPQNPTLMSVQNTGYSQAYRNNPILNPWSASLNPQQRQNTFGNQLNGQQRSNYLRYGVGLPRSSSIPRLSRTTQSGSIPLLGPVARRGSGSVPVLSSVRNMNFGSLGGYSPQLSPQMRQSVYGIPRGASYPATRQPMQTPQRSAPVPQRNTTNTTPQKIKPIKIKKIKFKSAVKKVNVKSLR